MCIAQDASEVRGLLDERSEEGHSGPACEVLDQNASEYLVANERGITITNQYRLRQRIQCINDLAGSQYRVTGAQLLFLQCIETTVSKGCLDLFCSISSYDKGTMAGG